MITGGVRAVRRVVDQVVLPGVRRVAPADRVIVPVIVLLVVLASLVGAAVVTVLLLGVAGGADSTARLVTAIVGGGYLLLAIPVGTVWVLRRQRLTNAWLWAGREPTPQETLVALRLPADIARIVAVVWAVGALGIGIVAAAVYPQPLVGLRRAVQRVGEGDTDVRLVVDDAGEIGLLQTGVNSMAAGLAERERLRDLFGRHVGTDVAARALQNGVQLGGETRTVAALFVDVSGSTTMAQELGPQEMVGLLNRFFTVVVDATSAEGGLVNTFEGDAALCVFGAPATLPDAAGAALRAARAICIAVAAAGEVDVGVGVAWGDVVAAQIGSASRLEYTVIGDAVDTAARLTELAKDHPGRALAADAVLVSADPVEQACWERGADVELRGRSGSTRTWVRRT